MRKMSALERRRLEHNQAVSSHVPGKDKTPPGPFKATAEEARLLEYMTCKGCLEYQAVAEEAGLEAYNPPCEVCVSPGRTPRVLQLNELAYTIYSMTSNQLIVLSSAFQATPIAIDLKAIEVALKAYRVPVEEWQEVIEKVQKLFRLSNQPDILDEVEILKTYQSWGADMEALQFKV